MRGHRVLALAVLATAVLVSASFAATSAPGRSQAAAGSITIAIGSEPASLDPQLRDDGGERAVGRNIYETLMDRTPKGVLVPGLAARAPKKVSAKIWQFKLRPGIKFSNGEPFNADTVVYSIKRILNPKFASEQTSFFGTIAGARKVNDLTVNILTKGPDPILPARMYWMTMVPPKASKAKGFAEHPVGTGPYTFVEWRKGDRITLQANPSYWGTPKPRIRNSRSRTSTSRSSAPRSADRSSRTPPTTSPVTNGSMNGRPLTSRRRCWMPSGCG